MKKIGVTQRVDKAQGYTEYRDGLDQRWAPLLEALGLLPILIPNGLKDPLAFVENAQIEGVLLSGGNTLSKYGQGDVVSVERDQTERRLLDYAIKHELPVLGVCRGLQSIVDYWGATLVPIEGHAGTYHDISVRTASGQLETCRVNSFHDFAINPDGFPEELEILAWDANNHIEMCRHNKLPVTAIMWHPEREQVLTAKDEQLIKDVFK